MQQAFAFRNNLFVAENRFKIVTDLFVGVGVRFEINVSHTVVREEI